MAVGGVSNSHDVANKFADFFQNTCTANDPEVSEKLKAQCSGFLKDYKVNCSPLGYLFDVGDIDEVLNKLKKGKACGADGLTTEHIIFAHPVVSSCLLRFLTYY